MVIIWETFRKRFNQSPASSIAASDHVCTGCSFFCRRVIPAVTATASSSSGVLGSKPRHLNRDCASDVVVARCCRPVFRVDAGNPGAAGCLSNLASSVARQAITCVTSSTSVAPSRISAWQPRINGFNNDPGIAMASRPCSSAWRAVIRDPLRRPASTTTTPTDSPLIRRLRRGKQ